MTRSVILLRGVNVGGRNKLPMKTFAALLEGLGLAQVRTYIQSGNAVCAGEANANDIAARIFEHAGFRTQVFVVSAAALRLAAERCPFAREAAAAPKSVHVFFLHSAPAAADVDALGALKSPCEDFAIAGKVLYLHTPPGFAGSKIADRIDRMLKTASTARNWSTILALVALTKEAA